MGELGTQGTHGMKATFSLACALTHAQSLSPLSLSLSLPSLQFLSHVLPRVIWDQSREGEKKDAV